MTIRAFHDGIVLDLLLRKSVFTGSTEFENVMVSYCHVFCQHMDEDAY